MGRLAAVIGSIVWVCHAAAGELAVSADWSPHPALAEPASAALAANANFTGSARAWADPASGCFAVEQTVTAAALNTGDVEAVFDRLRDDLAANEAIEVDDWQLSGDGDRRRAQLALRAGSRTGRVIATATASESGANITALTCFYDRREPVRCARLCAELLEGGR